MPTLRTTIASLSWGALCAAAFLGLSAVPTSAAAQAAPDQGAWDLGNVWKLTLPNI